MSDTVRGASGLTVVELVMPVVDDRGAVAQSLIDVLGESGLSLRLEATAAVTGASAAHAVATLLGGHGRDEEDWAVVEVERRWAAALARGDFAVQPGALEALAAHRAQAPLALVSNLPEMAVRSWVEQNVPGVAVATGVRGLPHPDALRAAAEAADVAMAAVTVLAHSPAVLLAAAQAAVGRIILVGPDHHRWTDLVPVTGRAESLTEGLASMQDERY